MATQKKIFCKFWKKYEHYFEHLYETASEIMSKKHDKVSGEAW